ncbi:hypothetical protein [Methanococcoides seepicolus]|uniref:Uncharacterized protein n=1 Tax=Methanococcoides seepicolus TaxID=2828780 RepID=A0A9E4ZFC4_9EURY|nr:hypothetical protein [Methanococcoides seepicolus]MCM1986138.1 hypothetical protein [Methanococcoides seepicolus]
MSDIKAARALVFVADSITTDHISLAGAIPLLILLNLPNPEISLKA